MGLKTFGGRKILRRVYRVLPSVFKERVERSAWRFGGRIDLMTGVPCFDTSEEAKKAAREVLGKRLYYTSPDGLIELREVVAERIKRDQNLTYDPKEEVTITYGATEALSAVLIAFIKPGDEVLLSDPSYFMHERQILMAEGKPVRFPLREEEEFKFVPEDIEPLITSRTKLLLVNSPNNPTGAVLAKNDVRRIADLSMENDLLLVWDEVYDKIVYNSAEHFTTAAIPELRKHSIMINSFSKTYAMTGWRVGYVYADVELMRRIRDVHCNLVFSMNAATQAGAIAVLRKAQNFVSRAIHEYDKRRILLVRGLNEIEGVRCAMPKGTIFAFPNVSGLKSSSEELAKHLSEKANIAVSPGIKFGPRGEGHLRLSFGYADEGMLKEALSRMEESFKRLR